MMPSHITSTPAHPLVPAQARRGGPVSTLPAGNLYGEPTTLPADLRALIDVVGRSRKEDAAPSAAPQAGAAGVEADDIVLPAALYSAPAGDAATTMPFREEIRAAGFGLIAGLFFMIPAVLWFGAFVPRSETPAIHDAAVGIAAASRERTRYARLDEPQALVPLDAAGVPLRVESPEAEVSVSRARQLIAAGDIDGARSALAIAAAAHSPAALFAMAETYDPNVLAAWNTRVVGADPVMARELYRVAGLLGHAMAEGRLAALQ